MYPREPRQDCPSQCDTALPVRCFLPYSPFPQHSLFSSRLCCLMLLTLAVTAEVCRSMTEYNEREQWKTKFLAKSVHIEKQPTAWGLLQATWYRLFPGGLVPTEGCHEHPSMSQCHPECHWSWRACYMKPEAPLRSPIQVSTRYRNFQLLSWSSFLRFWHHQA